MPAQLRNKFNSHANEEMKVVALTIGNHAALRARRAEQDIVRPFYWDVLGGSVVRQSEVKDDWHSLSTLEASA